MLPKRVIIKVNEETVVLWCALMRTLMTLGEISEEKRIPCEIFVYEMDKGNKRSVRKEVTKAPLH